MCGIAGIFDTMARRQIDRDALIQMTAELVHRGPDAEGFAYGEGFGFGHRRLSIIDPQNGKQPMMTPDGEIIVTFNGMIYNFKELRQILESVGHVFKTNCDTEVLLYAYKAWGKNLCKYLDGFYAFAIMDKRSEVLFLARDRFGKKPLYYHLDNDLFFRFSSELPSLVSGLKTKPSLSGKAIENYFTMGFIPDPKSIYNSICKLPAGHSLYYRRGAEQFSITLFSELFPSEPDVAVTYHDAKDQVTLALQDSVRKRLIADVDMGVLLSGGVDSAVVTALAVEQSERPIRTFTAGFPQKTYDERDSARVLAQHLGTDHTELEITTPDESIIDDMAAIAGEPFADASLIPTYLICRAAKKYVTVLLSGDGADELFFGYGRYESFLKQETFKALLSDETRESLFSGLASYYPQNNHIPEFLRAGATLEAIAENRAGGYLRNFAICRPKIVQDIFSEDFKKLLGNYQTKESVEDYFTKANYLTHILKQAQYVDIHLWLSGRMLVKSDRASMATGIELRSPLLDNELAKIAFALPIDYMSGAGQTKKILKEIIAPSLPEGYLNRPKRGFVFPLADMLRTVWVDRVHTVLRDPLLHEMGIFNPKTLRQLETEHFSKKNDHSRILWAILQFDAFFHALG